MDSSISEDKGLILLTGATGYVGGQLLKALEGARHRLRCLTRRPERLRPRVAETTQVVEGDLLKPASLGPAMEGVHTAYYLVHSMGSTGAFEEEERHAAIGFAAAAREAGLRRIVYLGGLGSGGELSSHLRSRQEVGRILRGSGVVTIEFQASIIIGAGSLSFEMVRVLVDKLPVIVTPRWLRTLTQPIAVEDVVGYLVAALEVEVEGSVVFEIGGADQLSYLDLMREYARQRGLRRGMIPAPLLTPELLSAGLRLIYPLNVRAAWRLIESVRNETVVRDKLALRMFNITPRGIREAIEQALRDEDR